MLSRKLRRLYEPLLSREALIACALIGAALLASGYSGAGGRRFYAKKTWAAICGMPALPME